MSDEDKAQQIGQMMLEAANNKKELASRWHEAAELSKVYYDLYEKLRSNADQIFFSGEDATLEYAQFPKIDAKLVNVEKLKEVANAIRKLQENQKRLNGQLSKLGYPQ